MELTNLEGAEQRGAASRSRLFQLLMVAFSFPDEEFHAAVGDGSFRGAVEEAIATLPYRLADGVPPELAHAGESYTEFQSEYIRLFDVGAAGPPCPLYGGVYIGDRMKVMEEATRFYNFFELRLSSKMRELPDHITTELEFLHYLTFRETEARQQGGDTGSLLRAQRDFLERHPCKWMPRLQARLAKQKTLPFFPALVGFSVGFFRADAAHAAAACSG